MFPWQIKLCLLMSHNDCLYSIAVGFGIFILMNESFFWKRKKPCRHYGDKSRAAGLCGWYINSSDLFHFPPFWGVNQGGRERTVTSVCPSPAACMAHVRRHGSVSARRAGWAACVTKVSLIKLLQMHLYLPHDTSPEVRVSHRAPGTQETTKWSQCLENTKKKKTIFFYRRK